MKYFILGILLFIGLPAFSQMAEKLNIAHVTLDPVRPARYARSCQDTEGNVYVMGLFKVSQLEDGELITRAQYDPVFPPTALNEAIMNTFYSCPGFFMALNNRLAHESDSVYTTKMWRSDDDLKSIQETKASFIIPEAGKVDFGEPDEWAGLICHRSVIRISDGSLLATMYGNFENDTIVPTNPQSKIETKYKLRAFVVRSTDMGKTWRYLSTVAVPDSKILDNTEGFNEWTMIQLENGKLLGVIRTSHFSPFVISYSTDEGRSWSLPVSNPELGPAGCDPYLLKLTDGRIALSYGEMVQPEHIKDFPRKIDHRRRCRLAISKTPDAEHWEVYDITGYENRSAYSTIFQLQADLLLYQTDLELYKINIPQP